MTKAEQAMEKHSAGYNCAQAVFSVFATEAGLDEASAVKVSCGFGGGMGRQAETCGAVTGAVMALSLLQSAPEATPENKARMYAVVRRFFEEFRKQNGSTVCRDLLGCDISTDEGMRHAKENGLFNTRCTGFIRGAATIVEQFQANKAEAAK